jgi:hypothetical protein
VIDMLCEMCGCITTHYSMCSVCHGFIVLCGECSLISGSHHHHMCKSCGRDRKIGEVLGEV